MTTVKLQHSMKPASFRRALLSWYAANDRALPWRQRWHDTRDPYCVWVSEIMLQQTLIKVVVPAYGRFMAQFPTVAQLAKATEEEVRLAARGLGYYRRFGMLHKGAWQVMAARDAKGKDWFPSSSEEWLEIAGIGPYTAAAIASITLGEPIHVLDGNVERVLCRQLALKEPIGTPSLKKRLNPIAAELLDGKKAGDFNQAMMELGQLVCTKANPACDRCPVSKGCLARQLGCQGEAPQPKQRQEPEDVQLVAHIPVRRKGAGRKGLEVGLSWRGKDERFLKESWGFAFRAEKPGAARQGKAIGTFAHSITQHKIAVTVFLDEAGQSTRWIQGAEVEKNLLANLDRKAWRLAERALRDSYGKP